MSDRTVEHIDDRLPFLPTTVIGSYSVPDWLERLKSDFYRGGVSEAQLAATERRVADASRRIDEQESLLRSFAVETYLEAQADFDIERACELTSEKDIESESDAYDGLSP